MASQSPFRKGRQAKVMTYEPAGSSSRIAETLSILTTICLLLLIALSICWELWLAPLRVGGSWLVLKAIPLLAPLRGLLHGRRYTYQWSSMLILGYIAEGIVRTMTERGTSQTLAIFEFLLGLTFFILSIAYVRITMRSTIEPTKQPKATEST